MVCLSVFQSIPSEVKRSKKRLFCFASKRNKAKKCLFRFASKRNEKIGSETKIFRSKTKQKYGVLLSLWLEAKNSKRKEAQKKIFFACECETDLVSLLFNTNWGAGRMSKFSQETVSRDFSHLCLGSEVILPHIQLNNDSCPKPFA
jgi:hypothetical protein